MKEINVGDSPLEFPGYSLLEKFIESDESVVYKARRNSNQDNVFIKSPSSLHPSPKLERQIANEFEVMNRITSASILRPLELEHFNNRVALILEYFDGVPLSRVMEHSIEIDQFLKISIQLAHALGEIHRHGVIHKNINPEAFLLNQITNEVKIHNFQIASWLPRGNKASAPSIIEGSLAYMSPEQTGRMNRGLDSRTDLYSLGVTFYKMLKGSLPFQANDPLGWIHSHVARTPAPLVSTRRDIPEVLVEIIMRLLSKEADQRYQNAFGLKFDLEECQKQGLSRGSYLTFLLGKRDVSPILKIPQKLYGREKEFSLIKAVFARVLEFGNTELVMVAGYSGVGKTSVINELQKSVIQAGGLFFSGKFDPLKKDIPYFGLILAFQDFALQVLSDSEAVVSLWRERFNTALGPHAALIASLIPQFGLILGKLPPIPELPISESQTRSKWVWRQFIRVFAKKEHPLVIFIDDLQWADSASLQFISSLTTDSEIHSLVIIGSYRDNEVNSSHPLLSTLEDIKRLGGALTEIALAPLTSDQIVQLVMETLRCDIDHARPLGLLVYEKTGGNSFFSIQFLSAIYQEGLIHFDVVAESWEIEIEKIRLKEFSDNVADLMVEKFNHLSPAALEVLRYAAAIGQVNEVPLLSLVCQLPNTEIRQSLLECTQEGLFLQAGESFKFLHDRVHRAAYSLSTEFQKIEIHALIGKTLLKEAAQTGVNENVFIIVNHLNLGSSLITDQNENVILAQLNLLAGKKAKASAAYAAAARYLEIGIFALPKESWETHYQLTLELSLACAECYSLLGRMDDAEKLFQLLLQFAQNKIDAAAIYNLQIELYITQSRLDKVAQSAFEGLSLFGIHLTSSPPQESVIQAYQQIYKNLGLRSIESLLDLPLMENAEIKAVMSILSTFLAPALFIGPSLYCLIVCTLVNFSLEFGNTDGSSLGFVFLGMMMGPVFNDPVNGFRFGKLAYDLVEKCNFPRDRAKVIHCYSVFVNHWKNPLETNRPLLERAFQAAIDSGDLTYACYCRIHLGSLLFALGQSLEDVSTSIEQNGAFMAKTGFVESAEAILPLKFLVNQLRGLTHSLSSCSDSSVSQEDYEFRLKERFPVVTAWYYIRKMQGQYMAGEYIGALETSEIAKGLLWTSPSFLEMIDYFYFYSLAVAADFKRVSADKQAEYLKILLENQERFSTWTKNCPSNFLCYLALLSAEIERVQGRDLEAIRFYNQAIQSSIQERFIHNEALAYELLAKFYLNLGFQPLAHLCLTESVSCYALWGAQGKVQHLQKSYSHLKVSSHLSSSLNSSL
ncbi:MAG: serine/threonine-protein kinase PknK, partial [Bdellovibrionia bacterium]